MKIPRRLAGPTALAAIVPALVLVAGCGGGSSSSGSTAQATTAQATTAAAATLTAAELRQKANAICADTNAKSNALAAPTSPAEIGPYLEKQLPLGRRQLARLRALTPPPELRADYESGLRLLAQEVSLVAKLTAALRRGGDPRKALTAIATQGQRLSAQLDAKADAIGLAECKSGAGTTTGTGTGTATTPAAGGPAAQRYRADALAAAAALKAVGSTLQGVKSLPDLKAKVPILERSLNAFDAALARMKGYHLDNATLEKQRAGLSSTGTQLGTDIRAFIAATQSDDLAAVQAVVPRLATDLQAFMAAAG